MLQAVVLWTLLLLGPFGVATLQPATAATKPPLASPESVGFSRERLKQLDRVMQRYVDEKQFAGIVTLLSRHGKVIHVGTYGKRDLESGAPLERESIFRIFSMTKPITGAAMMILYEEGKWSPQDPISKFIPQFAGLKVYRGQDSAGWLLLDDPAHPPTLQELMTHTAGFGYGNQPTPTDRAYRDGQDKGIFESGSLQAMVDRLAKAPLLYQPSSQWRYSLSADVQGYLIEQLSGMTLPQFLQKRIFEPLQMRDTDFYVPAAKRGRLTTLYRMNENHVLERAPPSAPTMNYETEPALPAGGAGLVSTADDYFRFAQMLLNGGEFNGRRILSPLTVKLMMSNHLPDSVMNEYHGGGSHFLQPRPGIGHGYDGAVVTDPGKAGLPIGKGSYTWDGAAGTWFWIDPTYDIVFVGLVQRLRWYAQDNILGLPPNLEELSRATTYQALLRPDL